ncbi:hypothetical protein HY251_00625 [bacterium]|nr:hypothetical protein [bacterium]
MFDRLKARTLAVLGLFGLAVALGSARAEDQEKPGAKTSSCAYCTEAPAIVAAISSAFCAEPTCKHKGANCETCKGLLRRAVDCAACKKSTTACKECAKAAEAAAASLKDPSCRSCIAKALLRPRLFCSDACKEAGEKCTEPKGGGAKCHEWRARLDTVECTKCNQGDLKWVVGGKCSTPNAVKAHGLMNCLAVDWNCPRCKKEQHDLRWGICPACAGELGICIVCQKKIAK